MCTESTLIDDWTYDSKMSEINWRNKCNFCTGQFLCRWLKLLAFGNNSEFFILQHSPRSLVDQLISFFAGRAKALLISMGTRRTIRRQQEQEQPRPQHLPTVSRLWRWGRRRPTGPAQTSRRGPVGQPPANLRQGPPRTPLGGSARGARSQVERNILPLLNNQSFTGHAC